jgi:hypothetical protein
MRPRAPYHVVAESLPVLQVVSRRRSKLSSPILAEAPAKLEAILAKQAAAPTAAP